MTTGALRSTLLSETRVSPVARKARRSGDLRRTEATRVSHEELVRVAQEAILPGDVTDVIMVARHDHGEKLPNGDWSGLGGHTTFGPAWVLGGRLQSEPIALFDSQKDARELYQMLVGDEGELWQRKQRRLDAIAAAEALAAEATAIAKENAKTVARSNEDGPGSSRPSRSREKPTASSGKGMSRRERLRRA